jgi:autonomous glycyl radical cofactor GrcA
MANRRYLSAIKALAQVRRLQVPLNVQVNVATAGGQQVNVGGAS